MPMISIIVPVYNTQEYLHCCIQSILSQTVHDFELILVDDGSQDNSGFICDSYAVKDARVKVIHTINGGSSAARNAGLDVATGDFIGFVDSDDYIANDMYENLLAACLEHQSLISMCGRYVVRDNTNIAMFTLPRTEIMSSRHAIENILTWNGIDCAPWDKLFSRTLFNRIRFPDYKYSEDVFVIPFLIMQAERFVHIGAPKYYNRVRSDSKTNEKFTVNKLDLLAQAVKLKEMVDESCPALRKQGECFMFSSVIYLASLFDSIYVISANQDTYDCLKRQIRQGIFRIFTNEYIDKKMKFISLLVVFSSWVPAIRINKFVKELKLSIR